MPLMLLESILSTLRGDGNVLIPVDPATRVLEIAYTLDQMWAHHQLNFPLIFLATQGKRTMEFAKSMLEWMSDLVAKHFTTNRETPFDFK
jgi:cleavage and polyadenylation specificity factor subunit 2